jgi:predicted DCC family thiol-disulfide oxidoreductase YuxK
MKTEVANTMDIDTTLYLIYDGECSLSRRHAKTLQLKDTAGKLEAINARSHHPLIAEALSKGHDLNDGIIVKYQHVYYTSTSAAHLLARLSLSTYLYKNKTIATLAYPVARTIRAVLLSLRGVNKISTQCNTPLFAAAFGENWDTMPTLFKIRYGNYAFKSQTITVKGQVTIRFSTFFSYLTPLLRITGALVPYRGHQVPVTVDFKSTNESNDVRMNRTFYYPNKKPYLFNSRFLVTPKGTVIEFMRFGLGVKMHYRYRDNNVVIRHRGYIWRILGLDIPMPLKYLLGEAHACETIVSEKIFSILFRIKHPFLGDIFEYEGHCKLEGLL